jgi:hypothetical protein
MLNDLFVAYHTSLHNPHIPTQFSHIDSHIVVMMIWDEFTSSINCNSVCVMGLLKVITFL